MSKKLRTSKPVKKNQLQVTWQYNANFVSAPALKDASFTLNSNISNDIQFDHNITTILRGNVKPFEIVKALTSPGTMRSILLKIADGVPLSDAIEYHIDEVTKANDAVLKIGSISKNLANLGTVNNIHKLKSAFDKAVKSYSKKATPATSLTALTTAIQKKPLMVIPKNSDKASLDRRLFLAKTQLAELLLTSIALTNVNIPTETVVGKVKYTPFGSRVVTLNNNNKRYSSYINEYNIYRAEITKDINDVDHSEEKFFKAFDISKFFASVRVEELASMLAKDVFANNPTRRISERQYETIISGLLNFGYTEKLGPRGGNVRTITNHHIGLTIESHTQHVLANYFLNKIVEEALTYSTIQSAVTPVRVYSYVDDFIIIGETHNDVTNTFFQIEETLQRYGLELAENKTTSVLSVKENKETLKELVRLPSRSYFDLEVYDDSEEIKRLGETGEPITSPYTLLPRNDAYIERMTVGDVKKKELKDALSSFTEGSLISACLNLDAKTHSGKRNIREVCKFLTTERVTKVLPEDVAHFVFNTIAFALPDKVLESVLHSSKEHFRHANHAVLSSKILSYIIDNSGRHSRLSEEHANKLASLISGSLWSARSIYTTVLERKTFSQAVLEDTDLQKTMMRASDTVWLTENYQSFRVYDSKVALRYVQDLNDENILEALQYFYITLSRPTAFDFEELNEVRDMLVKLNSLIITKYPSKIRFVSAINKCFVRHQISHKEFSTVSKYAKSFEKFDAVQAQYDFALKHIATLTFMEAAKNSTKTVDDLIELSNMYGKVKLESDTTTCEVYSVYNIAQLAFSGISMSDKDPLANSLVYFMYRMFNRNNVVKHVVERTSE